MSAPTMPAASAVPKPLPVFAGSAVRAGVDVAAGREAGDDAELTEAVVPALVPVAPDFAAAAPVAAAALAVP
ncbi:MAG: hypothetical protein V7704_17465 [Aurantimonas endophytica]|uniref:Uncharacterized protein n=1 Tax=Aurantimonas endophytica TaxID=1522175 RepID=A0A7W6MQA1_9HYPH|nr:hypothetical protein [Aurantimonas endophytica]MBB4003785.1 hypothetical protein [Aurantimonas endophytica]MCO6404639.1 hypothetical protein [Aurantimonas endophytica]